MILYDMMGSNIIVCNRIWYRYDIKYYDTIWYDATQHNIIWYVWYDFEWNGIWNDDIFYNMSQILYSIVW